MPHQPSPINISSIWTFEPAHNPKTRLQTFKIVSSPTLTSFTITLKRYLSLNYASNSATILLLSLL